MKMELPFPVLHSLFLLNQAGHEAFVVGGCVRDVLMGKAPSDWDITTSAMPEETLAVFHEYRTIETGIKHGTVTVMIEDTPLEITTYRVDGNYSDGRHPDQVSFTRSLKEDLKRRDFTVNAMAYHPEIGLVDPFRGQKDLTKKVVRCVGRPMKRFDEDALRILRGLRFSSVLGFSIHPSTKRAIHRIKATLSCVSVERIAVEFTKLLCGVNVQKILSEYADVMAVFLPEIDCANVAKRVSQVIPTPLFRLTALMFDATPSFAEKICKNLRFSNKMTEDITELINCRNISLEPSKSNVLHILHRLGPERAEMLVHLRSVADDVDYEGFLSVLLQLQNDDDSCYRLKDLAVSGEDLMAAGVPSGPTVGATLNTLLEAVMNGECSNQKDKLLESVTKKPVQ